MKLFRKSWKQKWREEHHQRIIDSAHIQHYKERAENYEKIIKALKNQITELQIENRNLKREMGNET